MSGSIYSEWALSDRVVSDTFDLSKSIGCSDFADGEELKNCLKSKSTDEIMDAVAQTVTLSFSFSFPFPFPLSPSFSLSPSLSLPHSLSLSLSNIHSNSFLSN